MRNFYSRNKLTYWLGDSNIKLLKISYSNFHTKKQHKKIMEKTGKK